MASELFDYGEPSLTIIVGINDDRRLPAGDYWNPKSQADIRIRFSVELDYIGDQDAAEGIKEKIIEKKKTAL